MAGSRQPLLAGRASEGSTSINDDMDGHNNAGSNGEYYEYSGGDGGGGNSNNSNGNGHTGRRGSGAMTANLSRRLKCSSMFTPGRAAVVTFVMAMIGVIVYTSLGGIKGSSSAPINEASTGGGSSSGGSEEAGLMFTVTQYEIMRIVTLVGAVFSSIGTAFIVFTYFAFEELHTFPYKLIALLSAANFFSSTAYYWDLPGDYTIEKNPPFNCYIGAGLIQYFDISSFLWTSAIAVNVFQVLVLRRGHHVEKSEVWYHVVCWGLPAIGLIVVASLGGLGDAGNWCWITAQHEAFRFGFYYIPLLVILLANAVIYGLIAFSTRTSVHGVAINSRLRLYLLVFVGVRIWSIINRVQNLLDPSNPIFALYLLQSIFTPLQGFANSMVYGFNKKVRQQYRLALCSKGDDDVQTVLGDLHAGGGQGPVLTTTSGTSPSSPIAANMA